MKRATLARQAAKAAGARTYETGLPCKRGHVAPRLVSNGTCTECLPKMRSEWKRGNPKVAVSNQKYYANNKDKVDALNAAWSAANADLHRQIRRRHYKNNRAAYAANTARRKSHIKQATPPWADLDAIKAVYQEAARITDQTGVQYVVDHIIPLRGKGVCGLHVPANLRVITSIENASKGNRWTCSDCGAEHDRDVNAAINIARVGLDTLAEGALA